MKIKMKPRKKQDEEKWIGELLDHVDEEKLLEMSAIHSDVPMPVPNQEKLAQSVIDKADLADEEEMARRKAFEKAYRRKQFIRGCIAVGCVAVILGILALCGVFDNVDLKKYPYHFEAAEVAGGVEVDVNPQFDEREVLRQSGFNREKIPRYVTDKSKPAVNMDALDNTVYDAASQYCEKNHYAVDECKITRSWYHEEKGKTVVMCEAAVLFMRLDEESGGQNFMTIENAIEEEEALQEAYDWPDPVEADWPDRLEFYLTIDLNEMLVRQNLIPNTAITCPVGEEEVTLSQQQQNVSEKQGIAILLLSVDISTS